MSQSSYNCPIFIEFSQHSSQSFDGEMDKSSVQCVLDESFIFEYFFKQVVTNHFKH